MADEGATSELPQTSMVAFLLDPLAALAEMRSQGDVLQDELGKVVISHELVRELLADRTFGPRFNDSLELLGITSGPFYDWMAYSPLSNDGDQHKRFRALMSRTFTPRSVVQLRPSLERTAHELIDEMVGEVDLMTGFAHRFPLLALCELIGVPIDEREQFARWADTIGQGFNFIELPGNIAAIDDAVARLLAYTAQLIERTRAEPRDDLVSRIALEGPEAGFPDDELAGFIGGLVFAGHETTKNQLGWAIQVLSDEHAVWDRLGADASYATKVVEEVMRHRSAVTAAPRRALADTEVGGCPVAAGEGVIASIWGANHDPAAFEDRFDPNLERAAPHVAFGHGAHHCLGAQLARAELEVALHALAARLEVPVVGESAWRPPVGITGPTSLMFTCVPR